MIEFKGDFPQDKNMDKLTFRLKKVDNYKLKYNKAHSALIVGHGQTAELYPVPPSNIIPHRFFHIDQTYLFKIKVKIKSAVCLYFNFK
jgi:hypothetical protein